MTLAYSSVSGCSASGSSVSVSCTAGVIDCAEYVMVASSHAASAPGPLLAEPRDDNVLLPLLSFTHAAPDTPLAARGWPLLWRRHERSLPRDPTGQRGHARRRALRQQRPVGHLLHCLVRLLPPRVCSVCCGTLVYSELPSPLRFFHSNSSATNCPVFSGPPASCSDLPCGRSTSCIDVPAEDALDELSASCSCELNTYPNPGTSKPRVLVPYLPLADPSGGCLLPLRGQSLTWTSDAVFTTLTKTRRSTVSSNLTLELQVNGTGWVRPSGKSGPVSWSVDTATLPTWMLLPQPMGNLSEPAAGAAGAFDSISLELSPSGIASTQHHSHQLVVWLDVAPPQPMPIDVTVLVYAEPVAQSCTLATEGVDYQQILEQAVVGFTARDLDGLPTTTAAPFTTETKTKN